MTGKTKIYIGITASLFALALAANVPVTGELRTGVLQT